MNSWEFDHFNKMLERIERHLLEIKKQGEKMATSQAQLDAILTQVTTVVNSIKDAVVAEDSDVLAVKAAVDALLAKVGTSADLTTEAQALQAALDALTTSSEEIAQQHTDLQAAVAKANA